MSETVPDLPKLLSLAVHEFRTPVTVVSGYLRMLLKERAGPLAENQRKLLEEAEKSCGRLSGLIGEMSELGQLIDGRQSLSSAEVDLGAMLKLIQENSRATGDEARIAVDWNGAPLVVLGDAARLRRAMDAVVFALRREIVEESELVISGSARTRDSSPVAWIALGTPAIVEALRESDVGALGPFDEWRGGCGLSLPLARRVIEMHGGRLLALPGERQKAGGVVELPLR